MKTKRPERAHQELFDHMCHEVFQLNTKAQIIQTYGEHNYYTMVEGFWAHRNKLEENLEKLV